MESSASIRRYSTRGKRSCLKSGNEMMSMNDQDLVRLMLPVLALFILVTSGFAGGWAVVTLNDFPDYAVAGKPLNIIFAVRQHGQTLLSGLQPTVSATTTSGLVSKAIV